MANTIEKADLSQGNFVTAKSRYINSTVIYYGDKKLITFETYKRTPIASSPNDRFYVITATTEYRPDLVAQKAYGDVRLWWKILEANNMKDIWDFKSGTNIVIPEALL